VYIKAHKSEVVAMGGEIARGKRVRQQEWYEADMIFPEYRDIALDMQAEESLHRMNQEAQEELQTRR